MGRLKALVWTPARVARGVRLLHHADRRLVLARRVPVLLGDRQTALHLGQVTDVRGESFALGLVPHSDERREGGLFVEERILVDLVGPDDDLDLRVEVHPGEVRGVVVVVEEGVGAPDEIGPERGVGGQAGRAAQVRGDGLEVNAILARVRDRRQGPAVPADDRVEAFERGPFGRMRRDPALEFLARHVRGIEAGAGGLGRGADEGAIPVEPVPGTGVDAEVRERVRGAGSAVSGLGRQPPAQRRVLVGDLPQKHVAEGAGRRDELPEGGRLARIEQGVVVVDRGPGKSSQPCRDVGGERQARGSCQREGARAQDRLHRSESSIIFAAMGGPEAHSMELDREALAAWYVRNRERSQALFDRVRPEAYESRPIALRNPICFYEGHIPAFAVNTLLKRGLGDAALDSAYEVLFERGIDPESEAGVPQGALSWPSRIAIRSYGAAADRGILDAFARRDIAVPGNPVLARGLAAYTMLEHEPMHQETLRYMWHRLPYDQKIRPARLAPPRIGGEPPPRRATGRSRRGAADARRRTHDALPFGWDNERPSHVVDVPAFAIDAYDVTNARLPRVRRRRAATSDRGALGRGGLAVAHPRTTFAIRSSGNGRPIRRGSGGACSTLVPLPLAWPVVRHAGRGVGLRAMEGPPAADRGRVPPRRLRHAVGQASARTRGATSPPTRRAATSISSSWDPVAGRRHPARRERLGSRRSRRQRMGVDVHAVRAVSRASRRWRPIPSTRPTSSTESTSCMKGASPATAQELVRPSFRNWFRATYPYVYATFRTVS